MKKLDYVKNRKKYLNENYFNSNNIEKLKYDENSINLDEQEALNLLNSNTKIENILTLKSDSSFNQENEKN